MDASRFVIYCFSKLFSEEIMTGLEKTLCHSSLFPIPTKIPGTCHFFKLNIIIVSEQIKLLVQYASRNVATLDNP